MGMTLENGKNGVPKQLNVFEVAEVENKKEEEKKEREEVAIEFNLNENEKRQLLKTEMGWKILPDYKNEIISIKKYIEERDSQNKKKYQ